MIIGKVWQRNAKGKYPQKIVTIPQSSDIVAGTHVMITEIKEDQKIANINLLAIAKKGKILSTDEKLKEIFKDE